MPSTPVWHDLPATREGLLALADEHLASARSRADIDGGAETDYRTAAGVLATADATIALALIARADTVVDTVDEPAFGLVGRDDET